MATTVVVDAWRDTVRMANGTFGNISTCLTYEDSPIHRTHLTWDSPNTPPYTVRTVTSELRMNRMPCIMPPKWEVVPIGVVGTSRVITCRGYLLRKREAKHKLRLYSCERNPRAKFARTGPVRITSINIMILLYYTPMILLNNVILLFLYDVLLQLYAAKSNEQLYTSRQ